MRQSFEYDSQPFTMTEIYPFYFDFGATEVEELEYKTDYYIKELDDVDYLSCFEALPWNAACVQ